MIMFMYNYNIIYIDFQNILHIVGLVRHKFF